ncbi:hypothetical protein ElyMa_005551500 [Elysia marginata]|uniref:Uncharacterized protein n=1 Tax=Elysia marginata TaxID=1093978 RepID=A0AAV4EYY6_9GAST|nr:hypothetical protein ElyMa_005551500 [Elysia marginata]
MTGSHGAGDKNLLNVFTSFSPICRKLKPRLACELSRFLLQETRAGEEGGVKHQRRFSVRRSRKEEPKAAHSRWLEPDPERFNY